MSARAYFDSIRTLDYTGISGAYAVVGSVLSYPTRSFCITNNTDGDLYFSIDGSTDHIFIGKGSHKVWDISTNKSNKDDRFPLPKGTQFYVKQITAPTSGAVYIECLY